jgi:hypothetical protein
MEWRFSRTAFDVFLAEDLVRTIRQHGIPFLERFNCLDDLREGINHFSTDKDLKTALLEFAMGRKEIALSLVESLVADLEQSVHANAQRLKWARSASMILKEAIAR